LAKLSSLLAKKATWAELEKVSVVELVKKVAESLGTRLTKQKLGQVVPVIGAAVGAGVNLWYVANIAEASYLLYRERFLVTKHGAEVAVPVRD